MQENFNDLIKEHIHALEEKTKWRSKVESFLAGFAYLSSKELLKEHMGKLTHIGINSLKQSSVLSQRLTQENLALMEGELRQVVEQVSALSDKFSLIEKALQQRSGIFSRKTTAQDFFSSFRRQERSLREQIHELNTAVQSLTQVKETLASGQLCIVECYALIQRDIDTLNCVHKELENSALSHIRQAYQELSFELTYLKGDLLTHQQILYQKYAAINILIGNVLNCQRNVSYITTATYAAIMNVVELQQILNLSQTPTDKNNSLESSDSWQKLRSQLLEVCGRLQQVATAPFSLPERAA